MKAQQPKRVHLTDAQMSARGLGYQGRHTGVFRHASRTEKFLAVLIVLVCTVFCAVALLVKP